jgi:class 3 adenylate cyclase
VDTEASAEAARPIGDNPSGRPSGGEVRTFLIADVRGYTRFTHEQGDEQAAELARNFAALARDAVGDFDGEVIELRGDEALAVFSSARQALRAAVELQSRSRSDPALPLGIGIGLDAGEAMPVEDGYRGGALNLASRLCSAAAPGQILVSETVVGLARRVEGIRFAKRRSTRLKGIEEAVPVIEAVPDPPLPPLPAPRPARPSLADRYRWPLLGAAVIVVGLAFAVPLALRSGGQPGIAESVISVPRSFVGLVKVDPETNKVVERIRTPGPPSATVANGSLWIGEMNGVEEVNPETGRVLARIPITGGVPGGIAGSTGEGLWIANPFVEPFALSEIDTYRKTVTERLRLPGRPTAGPYVGAGFVWLVVGGNTIFKIDPADGKVVSRIPYSFPQLNTANAAATGEGAFWIADPHALAPGAGLRFGAVVRIDAKTDKLSEVRVPAANEIAVAGGAVWVGSGDVPATSDVPGMSGTNKLTEINPATNRVIQTFKLPRTDGVTAGRDAVWVENALNRTAVKINPVTGQIASRIVLPRTTNWVGELGDSLWVGVWPSAG